MRYDLLITSKITCMFVLIWLVGFAFYANPAYAENVTAKLTFTSGDAIEGVFLRPGDVVGDMATRGALHVSGSESLNLLGEPQGPSATLIKFNIADLQETITSMCEEPNDMFWEISGLNLNLTECRYPNNQRFNRGEGAFYVTWLTDDSWDQYTEVWHDPGYYLDEPNTVTIGCFTNGGIGDQYIPRQRLPLDLPDMVLDDLENGDGLISLYLSAADENIGFVFNSDNITSGRIKPYLEIEVLVSHQPIDPCLLHTERVGPLPGDYDNNCSVDLRDLAILAANWLSEL